MISIKTEKQCLKMISEELKRKDVSNTKKVWNTSMMLSCFNLSIDYEEHMSIESINGLLVGVYETKI